MKETNDMMNKILSIKEANDEYLIKSLKELWEQYIDPYISPNNVKRIKENREAIAQELEARGYDRNDFKMYLL